MSIPTEAVFSYNEEYALNLAFGDKEIWPAWIRYPESVLLNTAPDSLVFREGDTPIIASSGVMCDLSPVEWEIYVAGTPPTTQGSYVATTVPLKLYKMGDATDPDWVWQSVSKGFVDYTIDDSLSNNPLWTLVRASGDAVLIASMIDGVQLDSFTWKVTGDWDCFGANAFTRVDDLAWSGVAVAIAPREKDELQIATAVNDRQNNIFILFSLMGVYTIPEESGSDSEDRFDDLGTPYISE